VKTGTPCPKGKDLIQAEPWEKVAKNAGTGMEIKILGGAYVIYKTSKTSAC